MTPEAPRELQQALSALRPLLQRALGISLVASLLVLAPSAYMLEVYDRVVTSRNHLTLAMLTLLVLMVYGVMEVLDWARCQLMHQAAVAWDAAMRQRVFDAMFAASLKRHAGVGQQPMRDFRLLGEFLGAPVVVACMDVPVALVFLGLVFAMHPLLGWVTVASAGLQTAVAWLNQRSTQPPLLAANRNAIEAQRYAQAALRNALVVEAMGMLRAIQRRWMDRQDDGLAQQARASAANGAYQAAARCLQNTTGSMLLGLGAWLVLRNELNGGAGMMIIASVLGGRVLAPLVQVVAQSQSVVAALAAWQRLAGLLRAVPPAAPTMALPAAGGRLAVDSIVALVPGSSAHILKGVSFALQPGEVVAVVGPSGAGKTTLARVLMGVWPTASGKVRLDGVDMALWDKAELGPQLGYLPQEVALFDGSLADNIARFGAVDMAQVEAAARTVGLHDDISALPDGYRSAVGRDGVMLSGGQRQRVGLARALYGNPVFVVLDEPNASLDPVGEAALAQAITLMKARGTTFVVMTHRTSVLAVADKMLVLHEGQVRGFGPRDEVLTALSKANAAASASAAARPASTAMARVA